MRYLNKLKIEDFDNKNCRVVVWFNKINDIGDIYGQVEITSKVIEEVSRKEAIVDAIYKICGNFKELRKEALEELELTYENPQNKDN